MYAVLFVGVGVFNFVSRKTSITVKRAAHTISFEKEENLMKSAFLQNHFAAVSLVVFLAASTAQIVNAQGVWTSQASPSTQNLEEVKVVNQNVAWACGDGGTVLRCIDGLSWTEVDGGAFGTNVLLTVCPTSANTALTSFGKLADWNGLRQLSDTTWIYRTTNGGSSWQTVFQQIGSYIEGIRMIDSLNGIAFGDPIPGDSTLLLLRTRDGGAHWSRLATGPVVSSNTSLSAEIGYQQSLVVTDTNHIWFTSGLAPDWFPSWIRCTTDGGKTWNRYMYPHPHVTPISFSDSLRGLSSWWGGGQGGVDRTTDGGETWTTLFSHPHYYWFGANASVAGGQFWMTDSSTVYEVNAGDTLQFGFQSARTVTPASRYINWIDMKKDAGSLYGWFVTLGGKIYKYEPLRWQFKKYAGNPILTKSASGFDSKYIVCPNVLYVSGTYRMWYQGLDGTSSAIGYATSPDGINWTKYAGNPVLQADPNSSAFDAQNVRCPRVYFDGQRFHMLYAGVSTSNIARIGYAYSSDGIHWTKNPSFVLDVGASGTWDGAKVTPADFRKEGSKWEMWYAAASNTGEWRTGYASAEDSVHWTRYPSMAPVLDKGAAGEWDADGPIADCVRKVGNDYHMWYENNAGTQIGYAVSYDGITWNKSLANPLLSSTPGTWDQGGVDWAWMIRSGKKHFLYYASQGSEFSIGLAIDSTTAFPDTTNQTIDTGVPIYSEVPRTFALCQNYPNPFNPSTTIDYQIPKQSLVTLRIFDLLGREMASLVNEDEQAGIHTVEWDASRLASGVYFYTITAGAFRETKRMILMK